MYADMEQWTAIRQRVLVKGESKRKVLGDTGLHHETLEKILTHSQPPGYRREAEYPRPKVGPRIRQILMEDQTASTEQRHTVGRIFDRIQAESYPGGRRRLSCYSLSALTNDRFSRGRRERLSVLDKDLRDFCAKP